MNASDASEAAGIGHERAASAPPVRSGGALGCAPADIAAVEAIVSASGTSFARGMRILPPDRRLAMHAIYAFCRVVDDIADEEGPLVGRLQALEVWAARVHALYAGQAGDPLERVLLAAIRRYDLREADFVAVIDGMRTDASTRVVAPRLDALDRYCDQVASAVGRLSVRAFGDASPEADVVAFHLGRALQLTNILRDLDEDAARGRLYLPHEWLDEAGIAVPDGPNSADPSTPERVLTDPRLPTVCPRVADAAARHFGLAFAAMGRCDRRAMRPARLMGNTYRAILRRLERRGWQGQDWRRPEARVRLPTWQKLALAAGALLGR